MNALHALLDETSELNRVRVTVHRACRKPGARTSRKRIYDELGSSRLTLPGLIRLDELRMLAGLAPRYLAEALRLSGGELVSVTKNLRTTAGIDYCADSLGNNVSRPDVANWMALSEDATAPTIADTEVGGEIVGNGLARAQATFAHTLGDNVYTLSHTFTAATSFGAVRKEGVFNAQVAGVLFISNTFTPTALVANDELTVIHSVSI